MKLILLYIVIAAITMLAHLETRRRDAALAGKLGRGLVGFRFGTRARAEMRQHRDRGNQEVEEIELHRRSLGSS